MLRALPVGYWFILHLSGSAQTTDLEALEED